MEDYSKMKKIELLEKCKELGIIKYSSKNKKELIELISKNINSNSDDNNSIVIENNNAESNTNINIDIKNINGIEYLKQLIIILLI